MTNIQTYVIPESFTLVSDCLNCTSITRNVAKLVVIVVSKEWFRVKYPFASKPGADGHPDAYGLPMGC